MAAARYHSARSPFDSHLLRDIFISRPRKRIGCIKASVEKAISSDSGGKRANLSAKKKERIKLPTYEDGNGENGVYHISQFFNHPSAIESILNIRALQSYQSLDSNLYRTQPVRLIRCVLPPIQLLNFRVAPVLDLRVTPSSEDCVVEMLSCKFEGSKMMERQNQHFSAFMRNHIKWESFGAEQYLNVDVKLNLVLEIYTWPFTLLPVSDVEGPGNKVMQTLLDRLVPLLVQQLMHDYEEWIRRQRELPQ